MKNPSTNKIYPHGLILGAAVNAGNMAGLAIINALLVLYCTQELHIAVKQAYAIYAAFGSLFYCSALLGGYLGGRFDYKLAINLGIILASIGFIFLTIHGASSMFIGLACFIMGCALIVPNLYCIIGKLYGKEDHRRDSGFTLVYTITNLGGMIAAFSAGFIANDVGFNVAFFIGIIIIILSLLLFILTYHRFQFYHDEKNPAYQTEFRWINLLAIIIVSVIVTPLIAFLLHHAKMSNSLLIILAIFSCVFIVFRAFKEPVEARNKLLIFLLFIIIGVIFWSLYMIAPSALIIFIHNNVNRHMGSLLIPAGSFSGLNPFFITICGPIVSVFLIWLAKKKINFSLPVKFSLGIVCMGLGYLALVAGILTASSLGFVTLWWIVLSYFLQSFGELFVGPTGFAMVGKLCPSHMEGAMMGFFRFSVGTAGALSGFLASATTRQNATSPLMSNPQFAHAFVWYGSVTIIVGISVLLLGFQMRRLFK